jgi:hypothetical protein
VRFWADGKFVTDEIILYYQKSSSEIQSAMISIQRGHSATADEPAAKRRNTTDGHHTAVDDDGRAQITAASEQKINEHTIVKSSVSKRPRLLLTSLLTLSLFPN